MLKKFEKFGIEIEVNTLGAELKALRSDDVNYIWYSDPKYWGRSAPVLFPVVGKLKGLKTIIKDKVYEIGQHGFLRDREFEYIGEEKGSYVFVNRYDNDTLAHYPFKFEAKISYTILKNGVKTTFTIKNIDTEEIYFNIGGHPAINCPLYNGEDFSDYSIIFEKQETINSPKVMDDATLNFDKIVLGYPSITKLDLMKETFYIDTIIIDNIKSRSVELVNKNNKGIKFSFENFSTFAIWTPHNDAPFVCLEPWQGYNDLYNTDGKYLSKADLVHLNKDEEYNASYTIELKK